MLHWFANIRSSILLSANYFRRRRRGKKNQWTFTILLFPFIKASFGRLNSVRSFNCLPKTFLSISLYLIFFGIHFISPILHKVLRMMSVKCLFEKDSLSVPLSRTWNSPSFTAVWFFRFIQQFGLTWKGTRRSGRMMKVASTRGKNFQVFAVW